MNHRVTSAVVRPLLGLMCVWTVLVVLMSGAAQAQNRKKIVLGEITVEGRRQKPQAFYILQRQTLNFEGLELKKSFLPKIEKSTEKQPF
jgi:hypothetical protein